MDARKEPDTYVIKRVSFGERLSGTIATIALEATPTWTTSLRVLVIGRDPKA